MKLYSLVVKRLRREALPVLNTLKHASASFIATFSHLLEHNIVKRATINSPLSDSQNSTTEIKI